MPNNTLEKWEEKTLDEICEKISAGGDKPEIFSDIKTDTCKIPIYSNGVKDNGLYGYTDKAIIDKPAITVSARGTIGFVCKRLHPYCPIVRLISLIPKEYIDLSFLAYAMNLIIPKNTGTSIPQLTVPTLKSNKIKYPNIEEQQRIVGLLDEAFENIEKAKQNTLKNLNNAKELFEVESNNIFKNLLTTSNNVKMSDITDLITKGASPKWQGFEYCEKSADSILFITSENVGKEELLLDNRKYLGKEFNEKQKRSILEKGDILTNIVGASIGRTTIFDLEDICNINQAVCLIRLKNKESAKYITKYMNSSIAIESMIGMIKDCARANVSLTNISDLYVPMPNIEEQQKIVKQLDELQEQIKKLEQIYTKKLQDLDELKQSILQKAFNGEL